MHVRLLQLRVRHTDRYHNRRHIPLQHHRCGLREEESNHHVAGFNRVFLRRNRHDVDEPPHTQLNGHKHDQDIGDPQPETRIHCNRIDPAYGCPHSDLRPDLRATIINDISCHQWPHWNSFHLLQYRDGKPLVVRSRSRHVDRVSNRRNSPVLDTSLYRSEVHL